MKMYKKVEIKLQNDRIHSELFHEINLNERDGWRLVECTVIDDEIGDKTMHRFEIVFERE